MASKMKVIIFCPLIMEDGTPQYCPNLLGRSKVLRRVLYNAMNIRRQDSIGAI